MNIRAFTETDGLQTIELFRKTVHEVCKKDYSPEQLNAWAPEHIDLEKWTSRLKNSFAVVADVEGRICGFASLTADGCVDMFYVAAHTQGLGVGAQLLGKLEEEAKRTGIQELHGDVSLTARAFFKQMGFTIEKEYSKFLGDIEFRNAIMVKMLN